MKPETEFRNKFTKALRFQCKQDNFRLHYDVIESNMTKQGIPDLHVCVEGKIFWIEFKVGKNKLEPLQESWMKHYKDCGGKDFVITDKMLYLDTEIRNIFTILGLYKGLGPT